LAPAIVSGPNCNAYIWQEGGGEPPHGRLGWAIDEDFGSLESLIKKMSTEGAAVQGSGWVVSRPACLNF
jgi:superoxide dismutase